MPLPFRRTLNRAVRLATVALAAGPALAAAAPPATAPAAALVNDRLPTSPGRHPVDARAWLGGVAVGFHFDVVLPTDGADLRGLPLVVSLPAEGGRDRVAEAPRPAGTVPFACLVPRCPAGHTWAEPAVQTVLRQLIDRLSSDAGLDPGRVYLTGYGPGAADTWTLGVGLADRLAGIAPIDGVAAADPAATVAGLWNVAVYAVGSRADGPMLAALANRPHRDFAARVDPSDDADVAAANTYADPTFWGWLFAQHRAVHPVPAPTRTGDVHAGAATVVPTTSADVSVSADLHALPDRPGYSVVPATLRLNGRTLPFDFGLYLPPGYPHAVGYRGGSVPTVVNLHWREFFGGADEQLVAETLPKLLVRTPTEEKHDGERPADPVPLTRVAPMICIMPHCPAGCRFERTPGMAEAVGQLIDQVVPALHADPDRVFLTGVSYGGTSSWLVGQRIADRIAGVIVCDGRRTADPAATAAALRRSAVYISAGDRDGDFTNDARRMVAALTAAGHPDVTYREIHGGGHFCFSSTYTDPAFWAWLGGRHRPAGSARAALASATTGVSIAPTLLALAGDRPTPPPPATRPAGPATRPAAPPPVAAVLPPATAPPATAPAATEPATDFTLDPTTLPKDPGPHTVRAEARLDGKRVRFRFWLYLPAGYGHEPGRTWPVVVSLHNRGMIGGDGNGSITGEGLPFLLTHDHPDGRWQGERPGNPLDLKAAAPFICLAPQCPTAHTFDDPGMLAVLDRLISTVTADCHGDPSRTYLTGFSYGASYTWLVSAGLPDRFAAIAPIDGRATPDPDATVAKLAHTAVYQVIGSRDNDFQPEAKRMVAALAGRPHPDFAFHVVPEGNHFCYGSVYTDPTFWTWMLSRHRTAPAVAAAPATRYVTVVVPPPPPPPQFSGRVVVLLAPASLPSRPGYAVVRPAVGCGNRPLSVPVGIWLPPTFGRGNGPLPVIVSLHNRYAIGMDGSNAALLGEGLPNVVWRNVGYHGEHGEAVPHPVRPAVDEPFIGIFPQCPAGQKFESAPMPEVIDKVIAAVLAGYGPTVADPDRVYGTGWSYGASCTWAVATAFPHRYAAIAINDGRAAADPAQTVARLHDVGIYLAVGERDGVFLDEERRMLDALAAGRHPNFVQRVVPRGDHQTYQAIYSDPAFWAWLFQQHRRPVG